MPTSTFTRPETGVAGASRDDAEDDAAAGAAATPEARPATSATAEILRPLMEASLRGI
jgi:hypothetical protein